MGPITFEDFCVDADNFRLTRGGVPVPLEPMVFDLLVMLVRRAGQVITRDEIIAEVWDGRFVTDGTVSTAIKSLRKALGDTGATQRLIRTVRGRGFEFLGAVEHPTPATPSQAPTARTPADPTLYVRASSDQGDVPLQIQARALGARLRTILGRIPVLRILAPIDAINPSSDHGALRRDHGVTLLADLFLLRNGPEVQVEATLIDTRDGTQTWSRSQSGALDQLANDTFLHPLVRQLEPAIVRAMVAELRDATQTEPRALLLQAVGRLSQKGWRAETFREAEQLLEQAVAIDPSLPLAHGYLALIRALGHRLGIVRDDGAVMRRAIASAERALDLDTEDSMLLGLAGCALADAGEVSRAVPILESAVDRDPNNGHAKTALGAALMLTRDFGRAEAFLSEGIRISPADRRLAVWGTVQAMTQLAQGKVALAERSLADAMREDFQLYMPHVGRIAVALAKEDRGAAMDAARDCLKTRPDVTEPEVIALVGQKAGAVAWSCIQALREDVAG